jgi:hypothetical protein
VRTWLPYEQAAKKQNKALLVVAAINGDMGHL